MGCSSGPTEEVSKHAAPTEPIYKQHWESFFERVRSRKVFEYEDIRFALNVIRDPDSQGLGAVALRHGVQQSPQYRDFAAALIESECISASDADKQLLLMEFALLHKLATGIDMNLDEAARAHLRRIESTHKLDSVAKAFMRGHFLSGNVGNVISIASLVIGSGRLDVDSAKWVGSLIDERLSLVEGVELRFWHALRGAVSGQLSYPAEHLRFRIRRRRGGAE
jgi:hypothetical protein